MMQRRSFRKHCAGAQAEIHSNDTTNARSYTFLLPYFPQQWETCATRQTMQRATNRRVEELMESPAYGVEVSSCVHENVHRAQDVLHIHAP